MPASRSPDGAGGPAVEALRLSSVVVTRRSAGTGDFRALDSLELIASPGELLGVRGPSGSGKTTLLHVIAGLLRPDAGRVFWGDSAIYGWPEHRRDAWRRDAIGFVFQDFHLIPELSVADNITLPFTFAGVGPRREDRARAVELVRSLGVDDEHRLARNLSRGEQQRVAIARALLRRPALILADEPTASLDSENAAVIARLLVERARALGATLICASHDARLLARLDRVVELAGGAPVAKEAAA